MLCRRRPMMRKDPSDCILYIVNCKIRSAIYNMQYQFTIDMDDRYIVDTPENIEFAYDIGGIGSRFLATIVDTLLIGIAELVVFFVLGLLVSRFGMSNQDTSAAGSIVAAVAGLIAFVILWS